jgi:hypothetical protein
MNFVLNKLAYGMGKPLDFSAISTERLAETQVRGTRAFKLANG